MFNRTLQVDVVKKGTQAASADKDEINFEAKTTVVANAIERGIKKIGLAVCAYVALDTLRKVVDNLTTK